MTLILNGTDNSATTPAVTGTDTDTGVYYPAANQVALATNGTQALRIDASQNTFLTGGYLSFGTNGYIRSDITNSLALQAGSSTSIGWQVKNAGNSVAMLAMSGVAGSSLGLEGATPVAGVGITFPATQSASSDANTLDDYEEGSWTPACNFAGTSCTVDSISARYVKIGRQVICSANFRITSKGAGSGAFELTGLPFACSGSSYNFGNCQGDTVSLGTASSLMPFISNGGSTSRVLSQSPTGHTDISNTNVNNGCSMYFMLVYTTAT